MEHILIPTDFSRAAGNATDYALSFFKGCGCAFQFLNTYTPDFINSRVMAVNPMAGMEEDHMQRRSEEGLKYLVERLERDFPDSGNTYETYSSFSLLPEEIRERVAMGQADLIVSGTTGASGLKEVFMGSNTVRILRAASTCPVLVVPEEASFSKPAEIGFATDFMRPFTGSQLDMIHFFVKRFDSELRIVHIGTEDALNSLQQFHKKELFLELELLNPKMQWINPETSKTADLQKYVAEAGIDLLVLIRNEYNPVEELLREPVVKRMAFHTPIPLLVLPQATL
jgi:nucleotide-binding universal stress UspA family protein